MSRQAFGTAAFSLLLAAATGIVLFETRPASTGDDALRVGCWLLAVACAAWLAITLLAYAAAVARADVAAAWRAARFAPPLVRRTLRTALAGALAVAPVTTQPPIRLHVGVDGRLEPGRPRRASTTTTTSATPRSAAPARRTPPRRRTPVASPRVHVVRPGDNLWSIARAEVARASGRALPSDDAVAPYWQRVIAANRATLRSGDPSLIFPGEIVALPNP